MNREVLAARVRIIGPDHPDTLDSKDLLASCLYYAGKHDEAAEMLREVLAGRMRTTGPDHPDTLMSKKNLAACLRAAGKHDEAAAVLHTGAVVRPEDAEGGDRRERGRSRSRSPRRSE